MSEVIKMPTDTSLYDCECECGVYYKALVHIDGEKRYLFNKRTLVRDIDSAKKFFTLRSIKRCLHLGGFADYAIIKFTI